MNYFNMSNSTCAALNYLTKGTKHDQMNHLGLGISEWTKRFKSHDHVNHLGLGISDWTKVFTVCTLRIAKSASPRCDIAFSEV